MNHEETRKSTVILDCFHDIEVRPINRDERYQWDELIRQHLYLGLHSLIGESIRYIAIHQGCWFALIGWSLAAFKCKVRDQWIGWPSFLQYKRLSFIANNICFLILPHVHIPNLASRVLALNLKRLSFDWQTFYGHPLYLAETFVDLQYFFFVVCHPAPSINISTNSSAWRVATSSRKSSKSAVLTSGKINESMTPSTGLTAAYAYVYSRTTWQPTTGLTPIGAQHNLGILIRPNLASS